jgi:hypothetical protein
MKSLTDRPFAAVARFLAAARRFTDAAAIRLDPAP